MGFSSSTHNQTMTVYIGRPPRLFRPNFASFPSFVVVNQTANCEASRLRSSSRVLILSFQRMRSCRAVDTTATPAKRAASIGAQFELVLTHR